MSGVSTASATFDPEPGTPLLDGASISRSLDPPPPRPIRSRIKRHRRLTSAHALLIVAVLAFAFAVGLLVRRLLRPPQFAALPAAADAAAQAPRPADAQPAPDRATRDAAPTADRATRDAVPAADATPTDSAAATTPLTAKLLAVKSTPPATLYVAGHLRGLTPVSVSIAPSVDRVRVALVAPGHAVHQRELDVSGPGAHRLDVRLPRAGYPRSGARRRATLRVRCAEQDIRRIAINGQDSGLSCPSAVFQLAPGRYRVSFLDFVRGTTRNVRLTLRARQARWLRITRQR
jgi:hypothetical protein